MPTYLQDEHYYYRFDSEGCTHLAKDGKGMWLVPASALSYEKRKSLEKLRANGGPWTYPSDWERAVQTTLQFLQAEQTNTYAQEDLLRQA